jgi:hypothetical protein
MRRFYYQIKRLNKIGMVWARSRVEALQIISYSDDGEFIGQIEWLTE